jgi:hypothetical protein
MLKRLVGRRDEKIFFSTDDVVGVVWMLSKGHERKCLHNF